MITKRMFLIVDKINRTWSCLVSKSIKVCGKLNILHPVTLNVCALNFFNAQYLK